VQCGTPEVSFAALIMSPAAPSSSSILPLSVSISPTRGAHGRALMISLGAAVVALAFTACGNNDDIIGVATTQNTERTNTVYALSGTPASLPAGYFFVTETLVRPQLLSTGGVNFEIAFDIDSQGRVQLLPARVVAPDSPNAPPSVGIQQSTVGFDAITRAPDRNYVSDSTFTAQAGDTFILQLVTSGCTFGYPIYAKLRIDSINLADRRIVFTSMVDRNCGFRGLMAGLPTN